MLCVRPALAGEENLLCGRSRLPLKVEKESGCARLKLVF